MYSTAKLVEPFFVQLIGWIRKRIAVIPNATLEIVIDGQATHGGRSSPRQSKTGYCGF